MATDSCSKRSDDGERMAVIVAGGGPSGMAAALFLVEAGIPVVVLERGSTPNRDPRAATYHPPTLEMFEPSGVTAELHERGIVARHWQFRDRQAGVVAQFDLDALRHDTRYPYRLQCEQHKLVEMLARRVAASPLATIRYDADVTHVIQDETGTTAILSSGEQLSGEWLIGADGGRSAVRKSQNIAFEGFTYPEQFLVITTRFDFGTLGYAFSSYTMDPVEWNAAFKVPGDDNRGVWRCVFPTEPQADESALLDFDFAQRKLHGLLGADRNYEILHTNLYAVHQRVAATYRRGRVLLIGDAAHVNNPLGGMGLNFGIHDAHNLANRLAQVIHGTAATSLLDQFDRQRRTIAEQFLQTQTIANKQTLEERDPEKRQQRQAQMRRIAADPTAARRYLLRTSMIEGLRAAAAIQ